MWVRSWLALVVFAAGGCHAGEGGPQTGAGGGVAPDAGAGGRGGRVADAASDATGAGGSGGAAGAGGGSVVAGSGGAPGAGGGGAPGAGGGAAPDPHACSDLFSGATLASYDVEISAGEWDALQKEFLSPVLAGDGSGYLHPWHPITFRLGNETRTDAMIRLKGDSSWEETIALDTYPKAQFVIAFDRVNNKALFHGVSKLNLDMPRTDPTYLHERLGNTIMRELGEPGLCAASARVTINGTYYGLYVVKEQFGHNLMRRIYPEAPDGDLWKFGWELDSGAGNVLRQQAFWAAKDIASMLGIIDLGQAVREWAAEIALNDADGYYGGDHNFYVYDYPGAGFRWLPDDLDSCFEYLPHTTNPIYWWEDHDSEQTAGQHYLAVINDPVWRARLVDAVADVLAHWDVAHIQSLVDAWAPQIAGAVEQDPHRWVSMDEHRQAVADMRDNVAQRPAYLATWVTCERTGAGADADGDGSPWCRDCNDRDPAIHPGAPERCRNALDDNCNGLKDDGCP